MPWPLRWNSCCVPGNFISCGHRYNGKPKAPAIQAHTVACGLPLNERIAASDASRTELLIMTVQAIAVQAIAGVSASNEARIMSEFPSVGAGGIGRLIGLLMDSIPIHILGVKLSYLLFGLLLAPLGALLFLLNKAFGARYILTNRTVQIWSAMGTHRTNSVDLGEIASVELDLLPGQAFFRCSDICLKSASGKTILRLSGVSDPGPFRNAIQSAASSRRLVQSSMATIAARK